MKGVKETIRTPYQASLLPTTPEVKWLAPYNLIISANISKFHH